MTDRDRVLVFDFDGTVALGDGPVRSYARFVAETLPIAARQDFLLAVEAGLEGDLPAGMNPVDGYELVRLFSDRFEVDLDARARAFALSRAELATDAAPVIAPDRLPAFLELARESAYVVLATNSPETRIAEALEALGIAGSFDAVHTSVGKPAGLEPLIDDWLGRFAGTDPAQALLSIGDIWVNDLEPARRRGASTALIAPRADAAADPTFIAGSLPELYPSLLAWLHSTVPPVVSPHRTTSAPSLTNDQR